jgi:hypothetical protein
MENSLEYLAQKYFLDKTRINNHGHNYIPSYNNLFNLININNVLNLMEIGIGVGDHEKLYKTVFPQYNEGNSLRMWRDYFKNAKIHGIDINKSNAGDSNKIFTHIANQNSKDDLEKLVKYIGSNMDIILDDGSHIQEHQVTSFMTLSNFLNDNGLYIIEDILPQYIDNFKNLSAFPKEFVENVINKNYTVYIYDTRSDYGVSNDFIIAFHKNKI